MEEKRNKELTKFFTVSSAVLSVLYAAFPACSSVT